MCGKRPAWATIDFARRVTAGVGDGSGRVTAARWAGVADRPAGSAERTDCPVRTAPYGPPGAPIGLRGAAIGLRFSLGCGLRCGRAVGGGPGVLRMRRFPQYFQ